MKKLVYLFMIMVISSSLVAQEEDGPKMSFGVYGGGNISKLLTDSVTDSQARIGYQYGGFVRYGGSFFVQGDVALFAMSSQLVDAADTTQLPGSTEDIEEKIDIQFIHVPLQLGYKILSSPDGSSAIWVAAGGYVDQIFKVKPNMLGLSKDDFKTTSLGWVATAGLDLWLITFKLSYQYGLTPVYKVDDQSMKYTVSFSAGIKF
jgi:hypothetical protein